MAATTFHKASHDTLTAVPTAQTLNSLQLPAESSWPTYPFLLQPIQQFTDEPNPRRQRVNYKLEIHQLALYQGKGSMEGDMKWKDINP